MAALCITALAALFSQSAGRPVAAQAALRLHGVFTMQWGDGAAGTGLSQTRFTLTRDGQADLELLFGSRLPVTYDQLLKMRGQMVEIAGDWGQDGRFLAAQITSGAAQDTLETMVSGSKPWVTVMCKFSDVAGEPKTPAYFQNMYSGSFPLLDHYWREQSYNQLNISGSQAVARWYTLPQPRAYYVTADDMLSRLANDCTRAADAEVNFAAFVGVNLMFNDNLDGYSWGGGHLMTLDGVNKMWYMTWEPPWGFRDLTVMAHEMGHGFGLPHSHFASDLTYDNRWDVMSDTWKDCANSRDATYGCLGQGTIAYHKDLEGWLTGRTITIAAGGQSTLSLEQLDLPVTANLLLAKVPIAKTNQFYTVEVRRKVGYDVKLPGQAVIIHRIDPSQRLPAQLISSSAGGSSGDSAAQWLVGETFSDAAAGITIRVDQALATGFVVTVSNNPQPAVGPTPTAVATLNPIDIKSRIYLPYSRR